MPSAWCVWTYRSKLKLTIASSSVRMWHTSGAGVCVALCEAGVVYKRPECICSPSDVSSCVTTIKSSSNDDALTALLLRPPVVHTHERVTNNSTLLCFISESRNFYPMLRQDSCRWYSVTVHSSTRYPKSDTDFLIICTSFLQFIHRELQSPRAASVWESCRKKSLKNEFQADCRMFCVISQQAATEDQNL